MIYAFAKRLTGRRGSRRSPPALLAFDGFHFVEERIATGEITIATLALIVLYALYRYVLAAQIRVKPIVPGRFGVRFWITFAGGMAVAAGLAWLVNSSPRIATSRSSRASRRSIRATMTYVVAFLYFELGAYLLARWLGSRGARAGSVVSYADGTVVTTDARGARRPCAQPEANDPPRAPRARRPRGRASVRDAGGHRGVHAGRRR